MLALACTHFELRILILNILHIKQYFIEFYRVVEIYGQGLKTDTDGAVLHHDV